MWWSKYESSRQSERKSFQSQSHLWHRIDDGRNFWDRSPLFYWCDQWSSSGVNQRVLEVAYRLRWGRRRTALPYLVASKISIRSGLLGTLVFFYLIVVVFASPTVIAFLRWHFVFVSCLVCPVFSSLRPFSFEWAGWTLDWHFLFHSDPQWHFHDVYSIVFASEMHWCELMLMAMAVVSRWTFFSWPVVWQFFYAFVSLDSRAVSFHRSHRDRPLSTKKDDTKTMRCLWARIVLISFFFSISDFNLNIWMSSCFFYTKYEKRRRKRREEKRREQIIWIDHIICINKNQSTIGERERREKRNFTNMFNRKEKDISKSFVLLCLHSLSNTVNVGVS